MDPRFEGVERGHVGGRIEVIDSVGYLAVLLGVQTMCGASSEEWRRGKPCRLSGSAFLGKCSADISFLCIQRVRKEDTGMSDGRVEAGQRVGKHAGREHKREGHRTKGGSLG
jgi:hypothetical protein